MLKFFIKTTTSKQFYTKEFKKVSRTKTILYLALVIMVSVTFITPIVSYKYFSIYKNIKQQLLNVPSKLIIAFDPNTGLVTNTQFPIILEFKNNNYLVLDTKSNYKSSKDQSTELVLKNKGYAIYSGGEIIDQQKYRVGEEVSFKIEFAKVKRYLNNVLDSQIYLYIITFFGMYLLILTITSVVFVSLVFGFIIYISQKGQSNSLTYSQSIKKIVFLIPYFITGFLLNETFSNPLPGLGIVLLFIGFLYTNKAKTAKS